MDISQTMTNGIRAIDPWIDSSYQVGMDFLSVEASADDCRDELDVEFTALQAQEFVVIFSDGEMRVPRDFTGENDAADWLRYYNCFCSRFPIPEEERFDWVQQWLFGDALYWYQALKIMKGQLSWKEFSESFVRRFGQGAMKKAKIPLILESHKSDEPAVVDEEQNSSEATKRELSISLPSDTKEIGTSLSRTGDESLKSGAEFVHSFGDYVNEFSGNIVRPVDLPNLIAGSKVNSACSCDEDLIAAVPKITSAIGFTNTILSSKNLGVMSCCVDNSGEFSFLNSGIGLGVFLFDPGGFGKLPKGCDSFDVGISRNEQLINDDYAEIRETSVVASWNHSLISENSLKQMHDVWTKIATCFRGCTLSVIEKIYFWNTLRGKDVYSNLFHFVGLITVTKLGAKYELLRVGIPQEKVIRKPWSELVTGFKGGTSLDTLSPFQFQGSHSVLQKRGTVHLCSSGNLGDKVLFQGNLRYGCHLNVGRFLESALEAGSTDKHPFQISQTDGFDFVFWKQKCSSLKRDINFGLPWIELDFGTIGEYRKTNDNVGIVTVHCKRVRYDIRNADESPWKSSAEMQHLVINISSLLEGLSLMEMKIAEMMSIFCCKHLWDLGKFNSKEKQQVGRKNQDLKQFTLKRHAILEHSSSLGKKEI